MTEENLPVDWASQFADEAKEVAALERPAIANIGFRGGVMTYGGNEIESNTISGIALAYTFEHTYYADDWDPDNPQPPTCFAQSLPVQAGKDGNQMIPHTNVESPFHPQCGGCPNLEWKSAPGSNGKACKQIRKIAFIPYNADFTAEQVRIAEVGIAKLPVTSVKNWKKYVNEVSATHERPPWAVVTTMKVKNHAKFQFQVLFECGDKVMGDDILAALNARIPEVQALLLSPYTYEEEEEAAEPKKKGKKKY
jgi:hypothetical protein